MSSKGQVVIPKELREKLGIRPGNRLRIYDQDGKIIIETMYEDDPWDGMDILDIKGDEDALVRRAMRDMGKQVLDGE